MNGKILFKQVVFFEHFLFIEPFEQSASRWVQIQMTSNQSSSSFFDRKVAINSSKSINFNFNFTSYDD